MVQATLPENIESTIMKIAENQHADKHDLAELAVNLNAWLCVVEPHLIADESAKIQDKITGYLGFPPQPTKPVLRLVK